MFLPLFTYNLQKSAGLFSTFYQSGIMCDICLSHLSGNGSGGFIQNMKYNLTKYFILLSNTLIVRQKHSNNNSIGFPSSFPQLFFAFSLFNWHILLEIVGHVYSGSEIP